MNTKYERITRLTDILREKKNVSVKELAELLHVSEMTVRRDIRLLKEDGQIKTFYGSIVYNPSSPPPTANDNYHINDANTANLDEKERIGKFAASLVCPDEILIVDTGSTTEAFARNLDDQLKVRILCYNHNILNTLLNKPNIDPIFSGGYYHSNTQMFESKEGISLIENTRSTKVFMSAAGVHQTLGVTCANHYEVATKKAIYKSALERILLVDSSKFSVIKSAYFADLEDFDIIITDKGLSREWVDYITQLGITLHLV